MESRPSVAALVRLSWPATIVFVALAVRNALDVWMVGSLGEVELAGIAGGVYAFYLPQTFGLGLLVAVNTLAAQNFGRKQFFECRRYCFQGFHLGIALGLAFLLLVPICPWLFSLSGHEAAVQKAESTYLQWVLFALAPQFVAAAANNFFFATGQPKTAMFVSLGALFLNGTLNYAFIFGNLGAPELGIAGAALATVIAAFMQAVVLLLLVYFSTQNASQRPVRLWFFLPSVGRLRRLIRVGLPNGIHECAEVAIWSFALVFLVGQFGTAHLAAAALLLTLMDIFYAPAEGLGGGLTALIGRDIGRQRHDVAQKWTSIGLKLAIPYMVIVGFGCLLLKTPLINALTDSSEVRAVAHQNFLLFPIIMISFSLIAVFDYALVGAGDTIWPTISHLVANVVFLICGGITVVVWFPQFGSTGIWTLATAGLVFVAALFVLRWRSEIWKSINLLDGQKI